MKKSLPVINNNKYTGLVIYEGPSVFNNNEEIVVIATGIKKKTANVKTGDMIQFWILIKDENPLDAAKNLTDSTICGDCQHRRGKGGSCYVNLGQAPNNIWKSYQKNSYPKYNKKDHLSLFKDKLLRFGAYGDPATVPYRILKHFKDLSKGHTAYTHAWKKCDKIYKNICMASVDSEEEFLEAQVKGWRTFRVRKPDQDLLSKEFICPASEEGNKRLTCEKCLACNGGSPPKGSVAIYTHGPLKKRFIENVG